MPAPVCGWFPQDPDLDLVQRSSQSPFPNAHGVLQVKTATPISAFFLTAALGLLGCGDGLGECDTELRDEQLGSADSPGFHGGQGVVQSSCAGGRCHDSGAEGEGRVGAPAELDFDVAYTETDGSVPARVQDARDNVVEWAEAMWAEIDADRMPPGKPLSSSQKALVRNWLACGADVAPVPSGGGGDNGLAQALPALGTVCAGCHSAALAQGGFVMFSDSSPYDPCVAYGAITERMSCAPLVVAGDPDGSLLLGLLDGTMTSCGSGQLMPPGQTADMPFSAGDPTTYGQLADWVRDGAPPPAGCE